MMDDGCERSNLQFGEDVGITRACLALYRLLLLSRKRMLY